MESIALYESGRKEVRAIEICQKCPDYKPIAFDLVCFSKASVKTLPTDLGDSLLLSGLILLRGGEGK